jgi:protease IV
MDTESRGGRIRRYFTRFFAVVGAFTVSLLVLLLLLLLLGRGERVPRQVILELDLDRGIIEYVPEDPFAILIRRDDVTTRDVVEALLQAETDDRVRGLVARIGGGDLGVAQVEEIRAAVLRFRQTGKPAVIFSETFGEAGPGRAGYYLATAFEEIHLQPSGDVGLGGLIAELPFLSGTLDRAGLDVRMDHRHEYKDALNLFTEEEMTEPQREATERVLLTTYENLVAGIATGRGLDPVRVRALIDRGPYLATEALAEGLVDGLSYRDEVFERFRERVGGGDFLLAQSYLRRSGRPHRSGPTIALVYTTGAIQRGESQMSPLVGGAVAGSETITRGLRQAVDDPAVRAILLRVDSPGGSYVASDAVWREVVRARAEGKPVVVSMGNVAASGGYFVAMGADRIVAQPSTITGSIGVYGGKILIDDLTGHLGVTWDDVRVGGNTTFWSNIHDYSPEEWARVQAQLDRIYQDFTAKVASGRGIGQDSVHAIARGRVWTGTDAHRLGLVDELGGYEAALRLARELIGEAPDARVQLRVFPRERPLFEVLTQPRPSRGYEAEIRALLAATGAGSALELLLERHLAQSRGPLITPYIPRIR